MSSEKLVAENLKLWEEWTDVHETSDFYDLKGFIEGKDVVGDPRAEPGVRLRPYEVEEVGDVKGKDLLHLQCHFGIDTLSWARLGANVTGADFSPKAIALARRIAGEMGIEANFVESNVYDLPDVLDGDFDVVYTSRGVLGWLPEIDPWAGVVAHFLRPGGTFYIAEVHPVFQVLDEEAPLGELKLAWPYFEGDALTFKVEGSYADRTAEIDAEWEHGWNHGLGEIVTALAGHGLHIESLRESTRLYWPSPLLERKQDGTYGFPDDTDGELPIFFSLKATKPA